MTLIEFMAARIAQDEADAHESLDDDGTVGTWSHWVLAECAAKRDILLWRVCQAEYANDDHDYGYHEALVDCLKRLATAYSDHPDFDPSWRP